jgi:hypothetical protein
MVNIMLPLRGAQAVFTIVVLGLTAYGISPPTYQQPHQDAPPIDNLIVTNWWANYWRDMSPVEINFLLFSSVFSLLTTIYLTLAALNKLPSLLANRYALLAADAVTMMFWFGGFVALAVFLSSRVCFGNVCNVAKASVAFGAMNWYVFPFLCMLDWADDAVGRCLRRRRCGRVSTPSRLAACSHHQRTPRWPSRRDRASVARGMTREDILATFAVTSQDAMYPQASRFGDHSCPLFSVAGHCRTLSFFPSFLTLR